jgi:hypothetical protein
MITFDRQNLAAMAPRRCLKNEFVREIATRHQHIDGAVRDLQADGFIICND